MSSMAATTAALACGGMTHSFQMRLEEVFFSVRPPMLPLACCRWRVVAGALPLACSTIFSSTTASSSSCNVRRARPAGGLEQANAINPASAALSKMRRRAEFGECFRMRAASNPSSTSRWRVRASVSTLVRSAAAIWLSRQPTPSSEASACNRMRAFSSFCAGCFPLWISAMSCSGSSSRSHDVFLYCALFAGHAPAPSVMTGTSIQRTRAESMTVTTRSPLRHCYNWSARWDSNP